GVPRRQDDLRHRGRGHRFNEARARANDATVLRLRADHETGDILNEDERRALPIAHVNEVSGLLSRLCVDDAAELGRPLWQAHEAATVSDDADLYAAYARVAGDHLFGIVGLKLVQVPFVKNARKHSACIVRLAMIFRDEIVK